MKQYKAEVLTDLSELNEWQKNRVLRSAERVRRDTIDRILSILTNDDYCENCIYWNESIEHCGLKNTFCTGDDVENAVRNTIKMMKNNEKIIDVG